MTRPESYRGNVSQDGWLDYNAEITGRVISLAILFGVLILTALFGR